jgi:dolichyl-diphosphooligosaccharide--protein glycosyltransferase
VLVVFGGPTGYAGDDLNKLVWMARAAGAAAVGEAALLGPLGLVHVDAAAPPALTRSVLFRASYSGYYAVKSERGRPPGWDRVRRQELGDKFAALLALQPVFTSAHWVVRIYRVAPAPVLAGDA